MASSDKMVTREYKTHSENETFELAKRLAHGFKGDEIVLLVGELGAGKTVFAKGLAAGLGLEDVNQVCSPSFTLINIYFGRVSIIHMDLYRLQGNTDIYDLGWEDYLGEGVILVEWAEKMSFQGDAIRVSISIGGDEERVIQIQMPNATYSLPKSR